MEKRAISKQDILRTAAAALFFIGCALIVFWLVGQEKTLVNKTEAQQLLYPLTVGLLTSGLLTSALLVYTQKTYTARPAWFYPVLSALLTLCGLGAAYIFLGIWPIGDKSCMLVDMHHQYAPLLSKLQDMILGGEGFFYSFELGMGASVLPALAYYFASPLNLLLVFFPENLLTEGIFLITILKNMLIAAGCALCLQYIYRRRTPVLVAVSLMYSMMMYVLAYSWNIMWLDGVMALPLVVMGFEHLMRRGKYLPYVLALAYALFANYYIAFMLCVFLVLYFFAFLFRDKRGVDCNRKALWRFTLGSLLGGGLAMILVLPTFLSLGQTSAAGSSLPDMNSYFDMFNLLGRHLYGTAPTIRSGNLPNAYCGVAAFLLVPLFALNRGIPRRRRITYSCLFVIMALCLVVNQFNLLWHGLHSPNDLPYRFSFVYCFMLLLIGYETLVKIRTVQLRDILISLGGAAGYLMLEERFGNDSYGFRSIYVTLLFLGVYAVLFYLLSKKECRRKAVSLLLLTAVTLEMTFNASQTFIKLNEQEHYTSHYGYVDNLETEGVRAAVSSMKTLVDEDGHPFTRMEFLSRRTCMDTALFNYPGITSFASSNSYRTTRLMGALGYAVNGVNSYMYRSFVPMTDALLGIRYVALQNNIGDHAQLTMRDTVTVTDKEGGTETYYVYENSSVLPLAYRAESAVKEWESSYYDPNKTIRTLYTALTGDTRPVVTAMPISTPGDTADEVVVKSDCGFYFDPFAESGDAHFYASADTDGQYFIYVDCRSADSIRVKQGGNTWSVTTHEPYFIDAGTLSAGDEVEVTVSSDGACSGNVYFLRLNQDVFESAINKLNADGLTITSFTDACIEGTVNASAAGTMVTTIPYDEGWTVTVDGKKVDTYILDLAEPNQNQETAGGALLGFDIPAGAHTVVMTFCPKGFAAGAALTVLSLLLLLAVVLLGGRLSPLAQKFGLSWAVSADDLDENDPFAPEDTGPLPEPEEALPVPQPEEMADQTQQEDVAE